MSKQTCHVTNITKAIQEHKVCAKPFYYFEIAQNGCVTPCCPSYLKGYNYGTLERDSFEEIWYGEKAESFRQRLLNGDYSICDKYLCSSNEYCTPKKIHDFYYSGNKVRLPQTIVISYDNICNLSCAICPPRKKKSDEAYMERMRKLENGYFPYMSNCKSVFLSGAGDPFGSSYAVGLIHRIVAGYPNIKFKFITNGQLLSPNAYFKLHLQGRIASLSVSIHAASQSTYALITGSKNFERIMRHLKFYGWLLANKEIEKLSFNFVVCTENYREMPQFAKMAAELGAMAGFSHYRDLKMARFSADYSKHAPFVKNSPYYAEFMKVLSSPELDMPNCNYDGLLQALRNDIKNR